MRSVGFPPIIGPAPRLLVLGSMPGQRSLEEQRYYAHPRNLFWTFMGDLTGVGPGATYAERVEALRAAGIALWDVLGRCERRGSLDTAIIRSTEIANPIAGLLAGQPGIRAVACNGSKALQAYRRHVLPTLPDALRVRVALLGLPSTSPANASQPRAIKHAAWMRLREHLGPPTPSSAGRT